MSKERLEEIERRRSNMRIIAPDKVITWQGWKPIVTLLEEDYKYLREQAERVQKLEGEIKSFLDDGRIFTNKQYSELQQQNKRYRESLENAFEEIEDDPITPFCIINARDILTGALEVDQG